MPASTRHPMNRTDSMQKLQLLDSQQEVLRRRLNLQVPSPPQFTPSSPEYRSLSSSPTTSRFMEWSPEPVHTSTSPIPTEPGIAHHHHINASDAEDRQRLCEINQQIKATLTELLNTDSVRSDEKSRTWIQERLMDVEQQIRRQRRRHSSGDREMAASIATHMSPHASFEPRL